MNIRHAIISFSLVTLSTISFSAIADDPEVIIMGGLVDDETETEVSDTTAPASLTEIYLPADSIQADSIPSFEELLKIEQERLQYPLEIDTSIDVSSKLMPRLFYMPVVYKPYVVGRYDNDTIALPAGKSLHTTATLPAGQWINDEVARHQAMEARLQQFSASYPWVVKLNLESLPEPPKTYVATVDPSTATIKVTEVKVDLAEANKEVSSIHLRRKNWLHSFQGSLQFSQAYNSPNWYQGGNNNLNLIGNFIWNVKLNPAFHPNLLFENTVQYKLAVNSAPDDTLRNYSISEDRFQINTKFGLKASHNWYYSVNMQFKTQLLQNHPTNSKALTAAFLSPGELNLGLGMTYNYNSNDKKTSFNVSIDPLSYNMICYRDTRVTAYTDKKVLNQYGSNIEAKLSWKPVYNITYTSRLYTFTNYEYLQGDWEHTVSFDINRFLTTQIYVHLRYDSSTKKLEDSKWHRWQLKEILSFGFAYKFNSI